MSAMTKAASAIYAPLLFFAADSSFARLSSLAIFFSSRSRRLTSSSSVCQSFGSTQGYRCEFAHISR